MSGNTPNQTILVVDDIATNIDLSSSILSPDYKVKAAVNGKKALKIAFELGAVDYIAKPVKPPVVKARVRAQLALYDQNQESERKVKQRTEQLLQTQLAIVRPYKPAWPVEQAIRYIDENSGRRNIGF